ncbi:MAG: hypothetical protein V7646_1385 [Pseudonocardia sp.]
MTEGGGQQHDCTDKLYRSVSSRARPVSANGVNASPDLISRVRNFGQADALSIRRVPVAAAP